MIPPDLTPGEIDARMGAAWIDASYVQQFLRELLDDRSIQVEHPGGQIWAVKGATRSVLATSAWGTGRYPAPQLAQAILEQRSITVHDTVQTDDGERTVLNPDATLAAQEKAAEMGERFSEWVWKTQPALPSWPASTTTGSTASSCATMTAPARRCPAWP